MVAHYFEQFEYEVVAVGHLVMGPGNLQDLFTIVEVLVPEMFDDQLRGPLEVALDLVVLVEEFCHDVNSVRMVAVDVEFQKGHERFQHGRQCSLLLRLQQDHLGLDHLEHLGRRELVVLLPVESMGGQALSVPIVYRRETCDEFRWELCRNCTHDVVELVAWQPRVPKRVHHSPHGLLAPALPQFVAREKPGQPQDRHLEAKIRFFSNRLRGPHFGKVSAEKCCRLDGRWVVQLKLGNEVPAFQDGALGLAMDQLSILGRNQGDVHLHDLHFCIGLVLPHMPAVLHGVPHEFPLHFRDQPRWVVIAGEHVRLAVDAEPQAVRLLSPVHNVALSIHHRQQALVRKFVDFDRGRPVGVLELDVKVTWPRPRHEGLVLRQLIDEIDVRLYCVLEVGRRGHLPAP
mmetsp:Transcript_33149/g.80537  ORF Transcript_33149/g.80537 Transcript_33149/m.80537 type:complete len:401 (+) Transcript_33149:4339-5541(+)